MSKNDQKSTCQAPEDDAQDKRCPKTTKNLNVNGKDLQISIFDDMFGLSK